MRTLAFLSLAAAAIAVPTLADAQQAPRAGVSWGQRGQQVQQGQRVIVRQMGPNMGPNMGGHMGQPGVRRDFRQVRRIGSGQFLPGFWMGPQFEVRNWQMYGFQQPMPGYRWVRYYDDAYMVDGRGRVREGRHGLDWDRYGDRGWGYDDNGVPVYVGDGDYRPDGRDQDWAEQAENLDWDYSEYGEEDGPPAHGGCASRCGGPGPGPGHGYAGPPRGGRSHGAGYGYEASRGAGYGYEAGYGASYGYGGSMVCCVTITETTVETGGSSMVVEEVIEERAVRQQVRRVHRRAPPRRPIRGERG
jgi:Ni/Co efflux regulator RcnB